MELLFMKNLRKNILMTFLLGIALLLYACGAGGGNGSSSGDAGGGSLFITDDLTNDYQQVIVTIYKVDFKKSSDGTIVTVFDDALGITYDLRELNGILTKLPNSSIPPGNYNGVFITVGEELILVNNAGTPITPNPGFASNTWTTCNGGKCALEITGPVNVVDNQQVVLDFDLKQFTHDPLTNLVTAKVVLDADGSNHHGYMQMREDDYELKGIIQNVNTNSFQMSVIKAEHFFPNSNVVTVIVDGFTRYTCDDDDAKTVCSISSITDLQIGIMVEVHGIWNGSQFEANKVEVDKDNDILTASCTIPSRSITEFSTLTTQPEIEGNLSYIFNPTDYSITVAGRTIFITKETIIKDETGSLEQIICADQIPLSANKIEVKYYQGLDSSSTSVYIANKIEFKA